MITTSSSNIDSPTIQQRQVTSDASLPSGTSVVLAGLIREVSNDSSSGIPLLHNIPGFGFLLASKGPSQRTELLIIITPKIIKRQSELKTSTDRILKKYQSFIRFTRNKLNNMAKVTKVIQRMFFRGSYVLTLIPICIYILFGAFSHATDKNLDFYRHLKKLDEA